MLKFIAWYNKLSILDALDSSLSAQKLKNAACKQKLAEKHFPNAFICTFTLTNVHFR